jgi:hypothetical protein
LRILPVRCAVLILLLLESAALCGDLYADNSGSAKLLLTAQQLKRLRRDRERKTERWSNFQRRVESAPDSPERGFELALYYAITHEDAAGAAAVRWAMAHPGETRQVALVADWCADKLSGPQRRQLLMAAFDANQAKTRPNLAGSVAELDARQYRDLLFLQALLEPSFPASYETWWNGVVNRLAKRDVAWLSDPQQMYALCEILEVVRKNTGTDLRSDHFQAFENLPSEYLLSLHPLQVEQPAWQVRTAALALIGIDPNLASAQFVQGWAMEDPRVIREGPGIAFEFLWADPYLPGLSFYNLDPWSYDVDAGLLYARTNWEPDSCWIRISASATNPEQRGVVAEENCPAGWRERPFQAGHLTLLPFEAGCLDMPRVSNPNGANAPVYVAWGLKPNVKITWMDNKKVAGSHADRAGMLRIPMNGQGKICVAKTR